MKFLRVREHAFARQPLNPRSNNKKVIGGISKKRSLYLVFPDYTLYKADYMRMILQSETKCCTVNGEAKTSTPLFHACPIISPKNRNFLVQ